MIAKAKLIKLHGSKLKKLNEAVYERDNHCCVICGCYVEEGVKAHHSPQGALKSDELKKMVTLCNECHYEIHHGKKLKEYKGQVSEYLADLYDGGDDSYAS